MLHVYRDSCKYNYVEVFHLSLWQLVQDSEDRPNRCVNPGSNVDLRGKDKDSHSLGEVLDFRRLHNG